MIQGALPPMMTPSAICLLGIPWDAHSSYMQGPSLAPADIRRAFDCDSANKWTESGIDLGQAGIIQDAGDLAHFLPVLAVPLWVTTGFSLKGEIIGTVTKPDSSHVPIWQPFQYHCKANLSEMQNFAFLILSKTDFIIDTPKSLPVK
jgi:hypothetical protein